MACQPGEFEDEPGRVHRADPGREVITGERAESLDDVALATLLEGDRVVALQHVRDTGGVARGKGVQRRVDQPERVTGDLVGERDDTGEQRGRLTGAAGRVPAGPADSTRSCSAARSTRWSEAPAPHWWRAPGPG